MRAQETWALCTALKSLAQCDALVAKRAKHERNAVNEAMSHVVQPVPATLRAPNHTMRTHPAIETALYTGIMTFSQMPAWVAQRS